MDYGEALSWIHSIGRFGMNQGLQRIELLLHYLGDPHKKLKFLHIGGTNGKGSTAAFAASVLEAAGYRVGLYTSPYLEQFTNRMSINGNDIPRERLVELVQRVKPLVEKIATESSYGHPTEFEVVTALAFCYFAAEAPDIVVLEVGLGGRLDATNTVQPLVTVITTISLEHTQVLGDTVETIAREKAGIIKAGSPVATQAGGSALEVLQNVCREKNVPLFSLGKDFSGEKIAGDLNGQSFNYRGLRHVFSNLHIGLLGDYQIDNAALALAALELLEEKGFAVPERRSGGLHNTRWPGRLKLCAAPRWSLSMERTTWKLFEPAAGAEALCLPASHTGPRDTGRQGCGEILQEILPVADVLIITTPNSPRAAEPRDLENCL